MNNKFILIENRLFDYDMFNKLMKFVNIRYNFTIERENESCRTFDSHNIQISNTITARSAS